jgi:hypothetical protein
MNVQTFSIEAITQAKQLLNGDHSCDMDMLHTIANKYGYNKDAFINSVYKSLN